MILNDSYPLNSHCGGGSADGAIKDLVVGTVPSNELDSAVPYNSMMLSD